MQSTEIMKIRVSDSINTYKHKSHIVKAQLRTRIGYFDIAALTIQMLRQLSTKKKDAKKTI